MSELHPLGPATEAWRRLRGEAPRPEVEWYEALVARLVEEDHAPELAGLAAELAQLAPAPAQRGVHLLAVLALIDVTRGSTRTEAAKAELRTRLVALSPEAAAVETALALATGEAEGAPALGPSGPILQVGAYLQLARLRHMEQQLGRQLRDRARTIHPRPPDFLDGVRSAARLSDEQRRAVETAASRGLTVVTGGPGTGKTSVVAALLEALAANGLDTEADVVLAAPTGKAARRLSESLDGSAVRPVETVHRLLGASPGRGFARSAKNPIPARFVVCDEASMLDLEMATRLVDALEAGASMVWLGDADQLPSVAAGAVLSDLVQALPADAVCRLTRSYRMDPTRPAGRAVLTAARALFEGDLEGFQTLAADNDAVRFEPLTHRDALEAWLKVQFRNGPNGDPEYRALTRRVRHAPGGRFRPEDQAELQVALARSRRQQLLTVTRQLGFDHGAEAVNRSLHRLHAAQEDFREVDPFLPGEPVMMASNDYERQLFNGDVGLVVRAAMDDAPVRPVVVFGAPDGPTPFDLAALASRLSLAHAMSVHKAQGSEYDEVALLLPEAPLPLLTREVLYTAATRARSAITLAGDLSVLKYGLQNRPSRSSGLAEALETPP